MAWGRVLVLSALNSCPPAQARFACPAVESNTRAGLFCGAFGRRTTQRPVPCPLAAMGACGKLLALAGIFSSAKSQNRHRGGHFLSCRDTIRPARRFSSPMRRSCSAAAGVLPATLSGVAEGSEGGCNSELGFCGISGKSGGRVGGLTGGGSFWALWPFGGALRQSSRH
jgi:hypothetical protein